MLSTETLGFSLVGKLHIWKEIKALNLSEVSVPFLMDLHILFEGWSRQQEEAHL